VLFLSLIAASPLGRRGVMVTALNILDPLLRSARLFGRWNGAIARCNYELYNKR
jgi:hypothetical protein